MQVQAQGRRRTALGHGRLRHQVAYPRLHQLLKNGLTLQIFRYIHCDALLTQLIDIFQKRPVVASSVS